MIGVPGDSLSAPWAGIAAGPAQEGSDALLPMTGFTVASAAITCLRPWGRLDYAVRCQFRLESPASGAAGGMVAPARPLRLHECWDVDISYINVAGREAVIFAGAIAS